MTDAVMTTYNRLPVSFERGEGVWLWDSEGRQYLDALSGIAVCGLGHAHPAVAEALCRQAERLVHTSNLYGIPLQEALAERLTALAAMERVFFANSGAEANEAAIKLARLHGHHQGIDQPVIVVAENSFHGRTLATLSATGNRRAQAGFEPLVSGFVRIPYNDAAALEQVAARTPGVTALLVEPIQGEGGIHIPDAGYLQQVREICDRHGWLMMLDEIQTGMGRTGQMFAFQHEGVVPDVITLAKGLGNGVPIGACLARGPAAALFTPGSHASTFGGNPLACAAALAVLKTLEGESLAARAAEHGRYLLEALGSALEGCEGVVELRGKGLMLGIELKRPCGELVGRALERGLLLNVTAGRVIRLLPPLIIEKAEADQIVETVATLVRDFVAEQ